MDGKTIRPPGEPLWRGVTMIRYESGKWQRQPRRTSQMYVELPRPQPARPSSSARRSSSRPTTRRPSSPSGRSAHDAGSAPAHGSRRTSTRSTARSSGPTIAGRLVRLRGRLRPRSRRPPARRAAARPGTQRVRSSRSTESLKASLRKIAEPVAAIHETGPDGTRTAGPRPGEHTCAIRSNSATRSAWSRSTPSSTRSRTSWSTARRATASISPAPWRSLLRSIDIPAGWSTASRGRLERDHPDHERAAEARA